MNSTTNLTGAVAAHAARILNRDLVEQEKILADRPTRMLALRVAAMRAELSELETASRR
jgi:hypothetical protein